MRNRQHDLETLLPLTPAVFHILLALLDCDRHGYGIMQEVSLCSEGKLRLGPGTLYRSIKQMLSEGLIVELDDRLDPSLDDQRRRYYRITESGRRVLKADSERLEHLVKVARAKQLLPGSEAAASAGGL